MWLLDFATVRRFDHCENACSNHLWQCGPGGNNPSKIGIGRGWRSSFANAPVRRRKLAV